MPAEGAPHPETTVAVIFGASGWPQCNKFQDAPSLDRSADDFIKVLHDERGLGISWRHIKSLFNSLEDPAEQLNQAKDFVNKRRRESEERGRPVADLILYYAGHGDFEGDANDFYLAIKRTHEDHPLLTSITARSIGNWVRQTAPDLRTYLIIDCCFAAAVQYGFMTSPLSLAERRLYQALTDEVSATYATHASDEEIPVSGVALLAAAGLNQAAFAPPGEPYSRFTAALLQVLQDGDERLAPMLSLSDVHLLVHRQITRQYPNGPRPELRPLQQSKGRVDLVPLFKNRAAVRLEELQKAGLITRVLEETRKAKAAERLAELKREAEEAVLLLDLKRETEEAARLAELKREAQETERLAEVRRAAEHTTQALAEPPPVEVIAGNSKNNLKLQDTARLADEDLKARQADQMHGEQPVRASMLLGLTLRIGVTGTRKHEDVDRPHVQQQVASLLRHITLVRGPHGGKPRLQLLSPLAEGADRLVASCALESPDGRYELVCPLPFPQSVYEDDFKQTPGSLSEFRTLLARAEGRILELDGARDDTANGIYAEARSYEALGRLIVRNCDLIIGIWDGKSGSGRGGTHDTIRYAARFGPPVIWINTADMAACPRWIDEEDDLRRNVRPGAVEAHLNLYLRRLLEPPEASRAVTTHGALHTVRRVVGRAGDTVWRQFRQPTPNPALARFLRERLNRAGGIWRFHAWFMQLMAGSQAAPLSPLLEPEDRVARVWFQRHFQADARAGAWARRYRSSYVWVFFLGAIALAAAACALAVPEEYLVGKLIFTTLELVALMLIAGLVVPNRISGWHRRSTDYRLLAELCREQQALAPLTWVVPGASAWASADPDRFHDADARAEPTSWVAWLFSAWLRDTALPTGTIDRHWVERARDAAERDLLNDMIDYHIVRRTVSDKAGKRLVQLGEIAFVGVLVVVIAKLVLLLAPLQSAETGPREAIHWLGLAGTILPAFSAMFIGIRAYAELDMLAEQSDRMLKAMRRARTQIAELDPHAPLASQALGTALASVATLMLEDLEGWARLFRGKVLDA